MRLFAADFSATKCIEEAILILHIHAFAFLRSDIFRSSPLQHTQTHVNIYWTKCFFQAKGNLRSFQTCRKDFPYPSTSTGGAKPGRYPPLSALNPRTTLCCYSSRATDSTSSSTPAREINKTHEIPVMDYHSLLELYIYNTLLLFFLQSLLIWDGGKSFVFLAFILLSSQGSLFLVFFSFYHSSIYYSSCFIFIFFSSITPHGFTDEIGTCFYFSVIPENIHIYLLTSLATSQPQCLQENLETNISLKMKESTTKIRMKKVRSPSILNPKTHNKRSKALHHTRSRTTWIKRILDLQHYKLNMCHMSNIRLSFESKAASLKACAFNQTSISIHRTQPMKDQNISKQMPSCISNFNFHKRTCFDQQLSSAIPQLSQQEITCQSIYKFKPAIIPHHLWSDLRTFKWINHCFLACFKHTPLTYTLISSTSLVLKPSSTCYLSLSLYPFLRIYKFLYFLHSLLFFLTIVLLSHASSKLKFIFFENFKDTSTPIFKTSLCASTNQIPPLISGEFFKESSTNLVQYGLISFEYISSQT
ncbi:hypothetical protein VP01_2725g1 [Puccinia sorghi]|uniref:Uncharacterized protein n=1 Tax=Puccinia sorghi TaxID=27349 RepID=A0A0L6V544_9BASI|nr:hypothetical protein VP01_2725g1 [Puccinia sorghi]